MAIRFDFTPLSEQSDDELASRFQDGDDTALAVMFERYRRFARAKTRGFFLIGADADDIEQEAMIGLFKAARDFRPDRLSSFRAFAELCITRQVITAVKTATRRKHQALNRYVSISVVRGDDAATEYSIEDLLHDHALADPADEVVSRERMDAMRQSMAEMLSSFEVDVLRLYIDGKTYHEIGVQLGRHAKSIDNALQRIRRKLDLHLHRRALDEDDRVAVPA